MTMYTLSEAAKATGLNRSTLFRAIRAGKISASQDEHKQWALDPAEVHRVYPPVAADHAPNDAGQHDAITDMLVAELRATIADLRSDRDHWREAHERGQAALAEALARQLPPPQQAAPPEIKPRRWWQRRSTG